MSPDAARAFAAEWLAGWNAHDLGRILAHYSEDVVFRSEKAGILTGVGTVRGKSALSAYWAEALKQQPELRFELLGVYAAPDAVTIRYRNQTATEVCETLFFGPDGLAVSGAACRPV